MKTKTLLTIATVIPFSFMLSFCTKDDTPKDGTNYVEYTEPSDEEREPVTTSVETKVYGELSDAIEFESGLAKRLNNRVASFNENSTKLCVITDKAISSNAITADDYLDIFRCYDNGGTILVTSPTSDGFMTKFLVEMGLAEYYFYVKENDIKIDDITPEMPKDNPRFRISKPSSDAIISGALYECVGFHANDRYICNFKAEEEEKTDDERTYGLSADAAVRWINNMAKQDIAADTKGGGQPDELTSIMAAHTYTYSHDIHVFEPHNGNEVRDERAVDEMIKIYPAHSLGDNMDYYYIIHDIEFHTGRIHPVPDPHNQTKWWSMSTDKPKDKSSVDRTLKEFGINNSKFTQLLYIKYFSEWNSSFELLKGFDVKLIASSPQAENGSTTMTNTTTEGITDSKTVGVTVGGSFGANMSGPTGAFNFSSTRSKTHGTSYSVAVGTSRSKKDISIMKYTENDTKVRWNYKGTDATIYHDGTMKEYYIGWKVGELQLSDMKQTVCALYRLSNQSTPEILVKDDWTFKTSCKIKDKESDDKLYTTSRKHKVGSPFECPKTFGSVQNWTWSVVSYGQLDDPEYQKTHDVFTQKSTLYKLMVEQILYNNVAFELNDLYDTSTGAAKNVLNQFARIFRNFETFGIGGRFVFKMTRQSDGKTITATVIK